MTASVLHQTIQGVQQRMIELEGAINERRRSIEALEADLRLARAILEQLKAIPAPEISTGKATIPELILDELRRAPGGYTLSQLAASINAVRPDTNRETTRTSAWRLIQSGEIENTSDGRYRLKR